MPEDNAEPKKPERNAGDNVLQKKVGPFPLWGWGVIVAAAVGVLFIIKKQQSGTSAQGSQAAGQLAGMSAGTGVTTADPLSMAALTESIDRLSNKIGGSSSGGPVPTQSVSANPPTAQPPNFGSIKTLGNIRFGELASQPGTPLYDALGNVTGQYVQRGQTLQETGAPIFVKGGELFQTSQGLINNMDVAGITPGGGTNLSQLSTPPSPTPQ